MTLSKGKAVDKLFYHSDFLLSQQVKDTEIPQHLYITTGEEIKDGDWYINTNTGLLHKCGRDSTEWILNRNKHVRKVSATTNPELWADTINGSVIHTEPPQSSVAKIPTSFIEQYIKLYNDGKLIKEVWLEIDNGKNTFGNPNYTVENPLLKLTLDGCVIIHLVEERMYTREEMKNAILMAPITGDEDVLKWFDKNYPK